MRYVITGYLALICAAACGADAGTASSGTTSRGCKPPDGTANSAAILKVTDVQ